MSTMPMKPAGERPEAFVLLEELLMQVRAPHARPPARGAERPLLEGRLEEFSPAEVLQMLDHRGHGELVVSFTSDAGSGRVWVQDHTLLHAELGRHEGAKAFTRLLGLERGTFCVAHGPLPARMTIVEKLDKALLSSLVQLDEQRTLAAELQTGGRYRCDDAVVLDRDDPAVQVLALADSSGGALQELLDESPFTDTDTLRTLRMLLDSGALAVEGTS